MQTHVTLANLGGASYEGEVSLRVFDVRQYAGASSAPPEHEELRQIVTLRLAPGAVSQPVLVGFVGGGDTLLQIEPALDDCDPINDEVRFFAPFIDCL